MSFHRLMLALVSVLLLAIPVQAATYWVSKQSTGDGNACNASATPLTTTAKLTIANAVANCLGAGDTVRVRAGTYPERISWPNTSIGTSWSNPAILEANPGEAVVWAVPSGSTSLLNIVNPGTVVNMYVIIRGFEMDGSNGANGLIPVYTQASVPRAEKILQLSNFHLLIENNVVHDTSYGPIEVSLFAGASDQEIIIRGNHFYRHCVVLNCNMFYIKAPGTVVEYNTIEDVAGSVGYWNENSPTSVNNGLIRNNVFRRTGFFWAPQSENGNHPTGGTRWCQNCLQQGGGGLFISSGSGTQAYGNEFYDNAGGIGVSYGGHNCRIWNNTVYGNRTGPTIAGFDNTQTGGITVLSDGAGSTGCQVRNNIVYTPGVTDPAPMIATGSATFSDNMCSAGSAGGIGCDVDDPGFVSAAGGNVQLSAGSPALNVGMDLSSTCPGCATDRLGTVRPAGAWDLGAYERGVPVNPDPVNLLAWWKLDEGTGTTAADSSGLGHPGTLDSAAWGPGIVFASAFTPTGTQEVTVANTAGLDRTTSISINAWVDMSTTDTGGCAVLSNQETYSLYVTPVGLSNGWIWNGASYENVHGLTSIFGAPHMLTLTYDAGVASPAMRLYVDAVLAATQPTGSTMAYNQSGGAFRIGRDGLNFGSLQCLGKIQQIRVYSGQLDQAAITNLFNEQLPAPGMSLTHSRYETADVALGSFPVNTDTDHSLVLGSPFRIRAALHKADTGSLTEFFAPHCRTFVGGIWGAWTAVANTLGSLGVRYHTDSAVNLGDAVSALLPLDGFTEVPGKVIADTVDLTSPYDAAQRITLAQGQHAEQVVALTTGAPLVPGNLVQCRPHRENAEAFCTDCYGGPSATAVRTLTLQSIAPPSAVKLGLNSQGGTFQ